MSRTFQDENLLVWEAFPSGGAYGFSANPHIIFHCLTDRRLRPRFVQRSGDEAGAERIVVLASPAELVAMLRESREVS